MEEHKRPSWTRRTYFVKPALQIKYLVVSIIVVNVTAALVHFAFWGSLMHSVGLEQLSDIEWGYLADAYKQGVLITVAIICLVVALLSVLFFHRLVGPIFVFERAIKKLANGDMTAEVHFRKSDELKDMAKEMQTMIANWRAEITEERRKIAEISQDIDSGKTGPAKEKLAGLTQWFKMPS